MPAQRKTPEGAQAAQSAKKNLPEGLNVNAMETEVGAPSVEGAKPRKGSKKPVGPQLNDKQLETLKRIADAPDEQFAIKDRSTGETFNLVNAKGGNRVKNYVAALVKKIEEGKFMTWDEKRNAFKAASSQFLDLPFGIDSRLAFDNKEQPGLALRFGFGSDGSLAVDAIPVKFVRRPALDKDGNPRLFNGNAVMESVIVNAPLKEGDTAFILSEGREATPEEVKHAILFGNTGKPVFSKDADGNPRLDKLGQPLMRLLGPSEQNSHIILGSGYTFNIKAALKSDNYQFKAANGTSYHVAPVGKVMNDIVSGEPVKLTKEGAPDIYVAYNVTEGKLKEIDPKVVEAYMKSKAPAEAKAEKKDKKESKAEAKDKTAGPKIH